MDFVHLHNHSTYSILDAIPSVSAIVKKAKEMNMNAIALTDHGNMFGMMEFVSAAKKEGIKPIIGCEVYVANGSRFSKEKPEEGKAYYHLVLLAKTEKGYKNLVKLTSLAYTEGFYRRPRIDKELLKQYHEDLIALSACLGGEPQQAILEDNYQKAKEIALEYKEIFGKDYYLEVQRHIDIPEEELVVEKFKQLSKELDIPLVATNDSHFLEREDSTLQEIMFAISDKKTRSDKDRRKYHTQEIYLKSKEEMIELFKDIPEAIENSVKIAEQCNFDEIGMDVLVPKSEIPKEFATDFDYLKHLVYEGLNKKYPTPLTQEVIDRAEYELATIKEMGFVGYFLIVQDLIRASWERGVPVGPGRGSAAGSIVAYAINITNIDPIKYKLLFERFLNPERVSMPDIDIDFADIGREKVIEYSKEAYGVDSVSQIVTFGYLKEKSSIKDVGRFLEIPVDDVNKITKVLTRIENEDKEKFKDASKKGKLVSLALEDKSLAHLKGNPLMQELELYSSKLQGGIRQTGVHAAGVIIAPSIISDHVPVCTVKGQVATQYDKNFVETAGLLKMDFLGLRTLSQIYKSIDIIEKSKGIKLNPEKFPLEDKKTWELFGRGDTVAVFQFESPGMQKYLKQLKPNCLEDIIAMNALYRPGPIGNIPTFIARKNGKEKIEYDHPLLEPILKETYGIIVYQEQVMQIGQVMGGFSLGKADILRRAMAKKKEKEMVKLGQEFIAGAKAKGIDETVAQKVFDLMYSFAAYGFNKSHAAAYSWVAYQTAYIKANYPEEFMAAILSSERNNADNIRKFISEAKAMKIKIIPPNVNTSDVDFTVGKRKIFFGLSALKNVGEAIIEKVVEEREKNGPYKTIFELAARTNLNKKVLEVFIKSGATSDLEGTFEQQLASLEIAIEYAQKKRKKDELGLSSLFGEAELEEINTPELVANPDPIPEEVKLAYQYELVGFLTSENPLEKYRNEYELLVDLKLDKQYIKDRIAQLGDKFIKSEHIIAGLLTKIEKKKTKRKQEFAILTIEDIYGSATVIVWPKTYAQLPEDYFKLFNLYILGVYYKEDNRENSEEENDDDIKLEFTFNSYYNFNDLWNQKVSGLKLEYNIDNEEEIKEDINTLKSICEQNRGNKYIMLNIDAPTSDMSFILNEIQFKPNTSFNKKIKSKLKDRNFEYILNNGGSNE